MHMKLQVLKTVGGLLFCFTAAAMGGAGCSTSSSPSGNPGGGSGGEVVITPPTGCTQDSTVDCSGGGDGFSCASGDNPEAEDSSLSCSTPTTVGGNDTYCCFEYPSGDFSSTTCEPDDDLTSACPDEDSYGYQCASGDNPSTLDSSLNCSTNTPDPDGVHDDYCCTYGGSSSSSGGTSSGGTSSGGTIPAGCTADSSVDCSGSGADGYSCAAGDNPEAEDSSLSCSTPTTDSSGNDTYCCFSWTYGDSSCTPDDDLTSACPDADSYGYQCDSGDDPSTLDSSLNCSTNTPDPDGVHDDYCCTY
jgi:hypothetical protein